MEKSIPQLALACFLVTWANPQALIDGSLLLGGFKASLPREASNFFILGTCAASAIWFFSITEIVSRFKSAFNTKVIKTINIVCGSVLIYYGIKLVSLFFKGVLT